MHWPCAAQATHRGDHALAMRRIASAQAAYFTRIRRTASQNDLEEFNPEPEPKVREVAVPRVADVTSSIVKPTIEGHYCGYFLYWKGHQRICAADTIPLFSIGNASNWLLAEPANSITSWDDLATKFLTRFFPPAKTARLRREIMSFRQKSGENLYQAWERFKGLLRDCPHHHQSNEVLAHTYIESLDVQHKSSLDTVAGEIDAMRTEIKKLTAARAPPQVMQARGKETIINTGIPTTQIGGITQILGGVTTQANVVADALSRKSMGTLAYLRAHEIPMGKEIRRLASLGVRLDETEDGELVGITPSRKGNLSPRYIGPYEITRRVGKVAYELRLPAEMSMVHPVFHISILRLYKSDPSHVFNYEEVEIDESLSYEEEPPAFWIAKLEG
ncbi:uncharacterized protein LOC132034683 [Lycium ferocissimum]|uniref:uncharacterized protein LOC132034683 n=1 Tax=Lycium ferocissimum TaxID=112874 RepID=UPI00281651B1|nr:uncharacterized protein LOC132034683 [Lycium ferocissimum]